MTTPALKVDPREWQPMETAPEDGSTIIVKLSNGKEVEAEYWCGPPGKERQWGGWAWNGTQAFIEGTTAEYEKAEWLGWKPTKQRKYELPE